MNKRETFRGLRCILRCAAVFVGLMVSSACGGLIGASEFVIASNARFPDAAYDSVDGKYLVVYMQYPSPVLVNGRFVTSSGAVSGTAFPISVSSPGTFFPAVAYNATNNEFLVTWDDQRGDTTWGQRVRASDGALLGSNFQISAGGGVRSAVGWNAQNNLYLVAYWRVGVSEVSHRRVSNTGVLIDSELIDSNDAAFSGYPAVASDDANQFLVTWDYDVNNVGSIRGQRVRASTGGLVGSQITVTNTGRENRSCIAYDPANSRWLVQFNQSNPGQSYDQYGQFVNTSGALVGGLIPIAATTDFEGDTQLGGDIAFAPQLGRFFSSFATTTGMGGIESLASGAPVTPQTVMLGTGLSYFSLNNAADTNLNRFLTVWEGDVNDPATDFKVRGRVYEAADLVPPAPVTSLTTTPGSKLIRLNWTNPTTSDFTGTTILYKLGSPPTGIFDGQVIADQSNAPGSSDSFIHTGLTSGTTYYYAAFAHDAHPNYASSTTASGVPAALGDFDADGDVDMTDFAYLQKCLSGDANSYQAGCVDADFDLDGDVDGIDVNAFLSCLAGADRSPGC